MTTLIIGNENNRRLNIQPLPIAGGATFDLIGVGDGGVVCANVNRAQAEAIIAELREVFPEPEPVQPLVLTSSIGRKVTFETDKYGAFDWVTVRVRDDDEPKGNLVVSLKKADMPALREWLDKLPS